MARYTLSVVWGNLTAGSLTPPSGVYRRRAASGAAQSREADGDDIMTERRTDDLERRIPADGELARVLLDRLDRQDRTLDQQGGAIARLASDVAAIRDAVVGELRPGGAPGIRQELAELRVEVAGLDGRVMALETADNDGHRRFCDRAWQIAQLPIGAAISAAAFAIASMWQHK